MARAVLSTPPSMPRRHPGVGNSFSDRPTRDRLYALRRLSVLSRLSGRLAELDDVAELTSVVHTSLHHLFEGACRVELYLAHPLTQELVASIDAPRGRALLGILRADSDQIVAARPRADRAAGRFPHLAVPRLVPADRSPRRAAILSAPLLDRGKLLGLIALEANERHPDFTYPDLDALVGVAGMVTMSLQRLRTGVELEVHKIYERDLEAAREIQRQFLPALPADLNGFQLAAEYRPAYVVGGDFYDVVPFGAGGVTAIVGDVSGKGVAAALVMSRVSSEFRRLAQAGLSPSDLLARLNGSTLGQWPEDTFVTAVCVRLDIHARSLVVANAGHVLPIVRRQTGQVRPLGREASAPLGMLEHERYVDEEYELRGGDCLMLMTDGVVEALDCDTDARRMWRVCSLMGQAPPDPFAINRRLLAEVDRPRPAGRRADDVTLLTLKASDRMRSIVMA
jgi:serine phosphatase RsbU (regulator of sigma subunit)